MSKGHRGFSKIKIFLDKNDGIIKVESINQIRGIYKGQAFFVAAFIMRFEHTIKNYDVGIGDYKYDCPTQRDVIKIFKEFTPINPG